jgi:hypothetical protein
VLQQVAHFAAGNGIRAQMYHAGQRWILPLTRTALPLQLAASMCHPRRDLIRGGGPACMLQACRL